MSKHVDYGCLVGPCEAANSCPRELGSPFLLKIKFDVNGDELKHLGRGWTRTPTGIEVRVWPKIMQKLMDLVPDDKKTSPLPGVKNEKKVEGEIELDAKSQTRFRSLNGLVMFIALKRSARRRSVRAA